MVTQSVPSLIEPTDLGQKFEKSAIRSHALTTYTSIMRSALQSSLRPVLRSSSRASAGRAAATAAPVVSAPASRAYSGRTYTGIKNPKPPVMGQPLARTHGHLVREGDLTPGIRPEEYEERRRRLMESLPAGAVVVCMGGTVRLVSQREFMTSSTSFFRESELTSRRDLVSRPHTHHSLQLW